jgi:hypothetical protein
VDYGYTLRMIGEVFDLSREWVRQLTPQGLWRRDTDAVDWEALAKRVAVAAVRHKEVWNTKGKIRQDWIIERFGKDLATVVGGIQHKINKLQLILRFRLGMEDDRACLDWLHDTTFASR